jgi:hypothetical protein
MPNVKRKKMSLINGRLSIRSHQNRIFSNAEILSRYFLLHEHIADALSGRFKYLTSFRVISEMSLSVENDKFSKKQFQ